MKRYNIYSNGSYPMDTIEKIESSGQWVRYSDIVNDPAHIPSMQINELCRKLESLGTSIEKGQIEIKKTVWMAMKIGCDYCSFSSTPNCSYNNCPLLKGIN